MKHALIVAMVLCGACGSGSGSDDHDAGIADAGPADAGVDAFGEGPGEVTFPAAPRRSIDLLFVIDNSSSMAEEQASLVRNFPRLIQVLQSFDGGLPSLHLGVVSTDVGAGSPGDSMCKGDGDGGRLRLGQRNAAGADACASLITGGTDRFLSDVPDPADPTGARRTTNYIGGLAEAFQCIASLGNKGCGFEQTLESMRRALDPVTNPGFLRADAFLAVVILSDEDDCSARDLALYGTDKELGPRMSFRCFEYGVTCDQGGREPGARDNCKPAQPGYLTHPDEFAQFLKDLKGRGESDDYDIVVTGIVGAPAPVTVGLGDSGLPELQPSCSSRGTGSAAPPVRTLRFLDQFPGRNSRVSICNDDLSDAVVRIGDKLAAALGDHCISGDLVDRDPGTPALEPTCTVADVTGGPARHATPIPACDATASVQPCWRARADAQRCTRTSHHLRLDIQRATDAPAGAHVEATCTVR